MDMTNDNGFILTGKYSDGLRLLKLNEQGNKEWDKFFTLYNNCGYPRAIAQDKFGDYFIVGGKNIIYDFYEKMYEMIISSTGFEKKTFYWDYHRDIYGIYSIVDLLNGGIAFCGPFRAPSGLGDGYSFFIANDRYGNLKASSYIPESKPISCGYVAYDMDIIDDGGFVFCGIETDDETGEQRSTFYPEAWVHNIWWMKYNSDGDLIWHKSYDWFEENHDWYLIQFVSAIRSVSTNGFILAGFVESATDVFDSFLIRLDQWGNIQWVKYFEDFGYCYDVVETFDKNFLLCGDDGLIKVESNGELRWHHKLHGTNFVKKIYNPTEGEYIVLASPQKFTFDTYLIKLVFVDNFSIPQLYDPPDLSHDVGYESLWLSWQDISSATAYELQVDDSEFMTSLVVNKENLQNNRYYISNLQPGKQYFWRVRAQYGNTYSDWSPIFSFYTMQYSNVSIVYPVNYTLSQLTVNSRYYLDRDYYITEIPQDFDDCILIKTTNDQKSNTSSNYIRLNLLQPAVIYVAYDRRGIPPSWLQTNFQKTSKKVMVSFEPHYFELWSKDVPAGLFTLGGNLAEGASGSKSNYFVLVDFNSGGGEQYTISGQVLYQNEEPVPNTKISLSPYNQHQYTNLTGFFQFETISPSQQIELTPYKNSGTDLGSNCYTGADAHLAASFSIGKFTPTDEQFLAADVDRDNRILMWDASLIARRCVAENTNSRIGDWIFTPEARTINNFNNDLTEQNFTAMVVGDVDFSWQTSQLQKRNDKQIVQSGISTLPIYLNQQREISSLDLSLSLEPNISVAEIKLNDALDGFLLFDNQINNLYKVVIFSAEALSVSEDEPLLQIHLSGITKEPICVENILINGKPDHITHNAVPGDFKLITCPNPFSTQVKIFTN